jgi:plastocyanin
MTAYYVIAIVIAVGAVVLSAIGLTREDFPPTVRAGRVLMAGTLVLVLAGIVALLVTTHREHPREEAAEAREKAAEERPGGERKAGEAAPAAGGQRVPVAEAEFSIELEGGIGLEAGQYTFAVANDGKIEHDLEIEGEGVEEKTPLISPGDQADLQADLKPGQYRFYCTVPGHAESGMDVEVTVR